ncbi:alpha/beta hydrolase [Neptunomonas qingdaonensis]|uniref:Phospholipase/carboxylesterase n=1 Tax=Neptunomonas qingdaonensis TaxID=1045558 RepID=A0A1I2U720_9GAMM|nr:alpha/beta hydrolase [Neptunomonas qingdaonensis]SFG72878.1 phospholipase/carboxylesterase [Neptunomonas qingdaonensis]
MIDSDMIMVETQPACDAVIIWMHGLGADGSDFPPTIPYLRLPKELAVRFLFPNAPEQAVTINGGMVMRSWYDILSMNIGREISETQLQTSVTDISAIVTHQIESGIAPERILLVGFSQGGAVAYETGLSYPANLGGIAAMSTYLPRPIEKINNVAALSMPLLSLHGEYDDVVPLALGESAVMQLQQKGYQPVWQTFKMAHEVSVESLEVLGRWIAQRLMQ